MAGQKGFVCRALLERLGPRPDLHSWSGYLPAELLAQQEPWCGKVAACGEGREEEEEGEDASTSCGERSRLSSISQGSSPSSLSDSEDIGGCPSPHSQHVAGTADAVAVAAVAPLAGRVWSLAQDPEGSREVQRVLDTCMSEEARRAIAVELRGHVVKAMRCPHANHVLQKCIASCSPEASQFVLDELVCRPGAVAQMARHRYGCRIVQCLLKRCRPWQVESISETLLANVLVFSCHPFGNYVIQHLIEYGTRDQRYRLIRTLENSTASVARSTSGCSVLAAAMMHGAPEDMVWLARSVIQVPGLLQALAQSRHGNIVVVQSLRVLSGDIRAAARKLLLEDDVILRSSRYGRVVSEELERSGVDEEARPPADGAFRAAGDGAVAAPL